MYEKYRVKRIEWAHRWRILLDWILYFSDTDPIELVEDSFHCHDSYYRYITLRVAVPQQLVARKKDSDNIRTEHKWR